MSKGGWMEDAEDVMARLVVLRRAVGY